MNWVLYTQLNYARLKPTNFVMNGIYRYPHRKVGLFTLWPLDVFVDEGSVWILRFFFFCLISVFVLFMGYE